MSEKTNIFILVYSHHHGEDVTSYWTREDAEAAAVKVTRDYRTDFGVPVDVTDEEAWYDWFTLTGGDENLEIVKSEIQGRNPE
jgi:hypothetical protein